MQTPSTHGWSWLRSLATALLMAFTATAALPQAAEPIQLERFFQRPALLDAKLSPSGRLLAITTSRGGAGSAPRWSRSAARPRSNGSHSFPMSTSSALTGSATSG